MFKTKSGLIIPARESLVPIALNGNDGDTYKYLNYCIKFLRTEPNMTIEKLEYLIKYISHELLLIQSRLFMKIMNIKLI